MKTIALAGALCVAALALNGCQPSATAVTDINTALATACPIVTVASAMKLNKTEAAALRTLELACPPNAPPTNEATVIADVVEAYALLKPLIK